MTSSRDGTTPPQWVFDFADGSRDMREQLGGKGANLAEMRRILGDDRVPAGFTVSTEACRAYLKAGSLPASLLIEVDQAVSRLERQVGKRLGAASDPLLVSVRSGARESMPGMLDTVLNLGLNDESVQGLAKASGDERFAWDCYRRLVQMFAVVVRGRPNSYFEDEICRLKRFSGVTFDSQLGIDDLRRLTADFRARGDFPSDPRRQLQEAVAAVFSSWMSERAVTYRRMNGIPDDWGTAVTIQQMVFGNLGSSSASGVAFSRDELTGEASPSGEFLPNTQGEDIVAGTRTPWDLTELASWNGRVYDELMSTLRLLERHYRDMQDTEWTVERGRLYLLQTRSAKRPARAAVRFAVDAVRDGLLSPVEALATVDPENLASMFRPIFEPESGETRDVLARGIGASPGAGVGRVVFTVDDAFARSADGDPLVLMRPFTEAEDVAAFQVVAAVITTSGGRTSHAAVVARGMGVPAVTGAEELAIDLAANEVCKQGEVVLRAGDLVAVDGDMGVISRTQKRMTEGMVPDDFRQLLVWADEIADIRVHAQVSDAATVRRALQCGAHGVDVRVQPDEMDALVGLLCEAGSADICVWASDPDAVLFGPLDNAVTDVVRIVEAVAAARRVRPDLSRVDVFVGSGRDAPHVAGCVRAALDVARRLGLTQGGDFRMGLGVTSAAAVHTIESSIDVVNVLESAEDHPGRAQDFVEAMRASHPGVEIGLSGDWIGSLGLLTALDVDFVSCSVDRVPAIRVAAGQAKAAQPVRTRGA